MTRSLILFFLVFQFQLFGQTEGFYVSFKKSYGTLLVHKPEVNHLANYKISGFSLGLEKIRYAPESWLAEYNYPSYGLIYNYHNMGAPALGEVHSLTSFLRFYFLKRRLYLTTGLGAGITTNPFDENENPKNIAYGSVLMANFLFELNYRSPSFFNDRFNFEAGLFLQHLSNAKIKSPNAGTNHYGIQLGLSYQLKETTQNDRLVLINNSKKQQKLYKSLSYQFIVASGINDMTIVNTKPYPFFTFTGQVSKRLGYKSSIYLGSDLFLSYTAKESIKFEAAAFPENEIEADDDWRRLGVFIGHGLHFNKIKFISQLGYYVYNPANYLGRTYFRIGFQYQFSRRFFASLLLKTHSAKAESLECGIGFKL